MIDWKEGDIVSYDEGKGVFVLGAHVRGTIFKYYGYRHDTADDWIGVQGHIGPGDELDVGYFPDYDYKRHPDPDGKIWADYCAWRLING